MAIKKARLYSADATEVVRQPATAADAATWTPDDIADEDDREAVILDAREWETIRIYPEFRDGSGDVAAGTSIALTPLLRVNDERGAAVRGRRWLELAQVTVNDNAVAEIAVNGHFAAFRIDTLTLGGATDGQLRVTGGKRRTQESD